VDDGAVGDDPNEESSCSEVDDSSDSDSKKFVASDDETKH
jgi:hypothetical protein